MVNWIYRQLFQIGDLAFRAYCFLVRPTRRGAYIAVWWDEKILLVENSYRTELTLPSGGVAPRETPLDGARRELQEEVGIVIDSDRFKLLSKFTLEHDNMVDQVFAYEIRLNQSPEIRVDRREVTRARFESLDTALSMNLSAVASHILRLYRSS